MWGTIVNGKKSSVQDQRLLNSTSPRTKAIFTYGGVHAKPSTLIESNNPHLACGEQLFNGKKSSVQDQRLLNSTSPRTKAIFTYGGVHAKPSTLIESNNPHLACWEQLFNGKKSSVQDQRLLNSTSPRTKAIFTYGGVHAKPSTLIESNNPHLACGEQLFNGKKSSVQDQRLLNSTSPRTKAIFTYGGVHAKPSTLIESNNPHLACGEQLFNGKKSSVQDQRLLNSTSPRTKAIFTYGGVHAKPSTLIESNNPHLACGEQLFNGKKSSVQDQRPLNSTSPRTKAIFTYGGVHAKPSTLIESNNPHLACGEQLFKGKKSSVQDQRLLNSASPRTKAISRMVGFTQSHQL